MTALFGGKEVTVQEESQAAQCSGSSHDVPALQEKGTRSKGEAECIAVVVPTVLCAIPAQDGGSPGLSRLLLKSPLASLPFLQNWAEDPHLCWLFGFSQVPSRQLSLALALTISGRFSAAHNFHSGK